MERSVAGSTGAVIAGNVSLRAHQGIDRPGARAASANAQGLFLRRLRRDVDCRPIPAAVRPDGRRVHARQNARTKTRASGW